MSTFKEKIRNFSYEVADFLTPWSYILYQSLAPVLMTAIVTITFLSLDQAQEVLYGTIDRESGSIQMFYFALGIFIFATTVWYTSRLLVTIDSELQLPLNMRSGLLLTKVQGAIVRLPRILGAVCAALLVAVFLHAQQAWGKQTLLTSIMPWAATLLPLLMVMLIMPLKLRALKASISWVGVAALSAFLVMFCQTEQFNLPVFGSSLLMTYIPVSLFVITVVRRPLLRKLKIAIPDRDKGRLFDQAIRQLFGLFIASSVVYLFLIFGTESLTRKIGSGAIVMLFCTSALLLLGLLTLCFRRLNRYLPGFVLTGTLVLSLVYVLLHAQIGWSPLKEISGKEVLEIPSKELFPQKVQTAKNQDIIVNAYGGGLRAGLFTAKLLARIDDMSCGEFGQKLDRLSGVSGGSLGIAIYATLRQEYVVSGGWPADCKQKMPRLPNLEPLVSDVLVQDHLSPILARMLSIDLVPGITPQRGQALLNSWQDATQKVLINLKSQRVPNGSNAISLLALARPITELNAGVIPAPKIYFNSTDSGAGQRLWLSNTGNWGGGLKERR